MGKPKILAIHVVTDSRRGVKGLQQTETAAARMGRRVQSAGKYAAVGLLAVAAAGLKAAQAAADDEASATKLASALRKNAGARKADIKATEDWIDKQARAKGVADDELRPALATLVRATGNVAKSQKTLSLAMDISAATGKPLEAVTAALSKGYGGQTTALGRLLPGMDKTLLKSGDMNKITKELARTMGGTAAEAAETNAGKLARAKIAAGELEEQLGSFLLPTLGFLATALGTATTYAQNNSNTVLIAVGVFAALAATVLVVNGVMKLYAAGLAIVNGVKRIGTALTIARTAAQYALGTAWLAGRIAALAFAAGVRLVNAAMRANPIGLVITALTVVAGLFVLAYKRSSTFRGIVQATGRAASAALGWIVDKAKSVRDWFGKLGPAAGKAKDVAVGAFKLYISPITLVIDAVKRLIDWIKKIKFPKPPGWMKKAGGLVGLGGPPGPPRPGGGPPPTWVPGGGRGGPGGGGMLVAAGGSSAGGDTYNIYVQGEVLDRKGTAELLEELLVDLGRLRGRAVKLA